MATTDEAQDRVATLQELRSAQGRDRRTLFRFLLGIVVEVAVAFWLLSVAKGEYAWTVWIAYLILASAALATLVALAWYGLWFAEHGLGWYMAAFLSIIGACLLIWGPKINWSVIFELASFAH